MIAPTPKPSPRQFDSSTAAWVRLCGKTVALAAAWADFKLALDDYGLICHGDDGGIAEGPTSERQVLGHHESVRERQGRQSDLEELRAVTVELARWSQVAIRNGELHARVASALALSAREEAE